MCIYLMLLSQFYLLQSYEDLEIFSKNKTTKPEFRLLNFPRYSDVFIVPFCCFNLLNYDIFRLRFVNTKAEKKKKKIDNLYKFLRIKSS